MEIETFDINAFNGAVTALTASFEPTSDQKEELKTASREQVLAGIANLTLIGNVPSSIIICMAASTNSYFDNLTGEFDFDKWKELIEKCALIPPPVTLPERPVFETRAVMLALAVGYGIGMTVAFILK